MTQNQVSCNKCRTRDAFEESLACQCSCHTPTPSKSWEEEFRCKWEGANIGDCISTPVMENILSDISSLLTSQLQQFREEKEMMVNEIPDIGMMKGLDLSCSEFKQTLRDKYLKEPL